MWYGHGWWMGLWWVVVVGGLVWAFWLATRTRAHPSEPSAEEMLRRRYANGELDEAEYRRRLAVLTEGHRETR